MAAVVGIVALNGGIEHRKAIFSSAFGDIHRQIRAVQDAGEIGAAGWAQGDADAAADAVADPADGPDDTVGDGGGDGLDGFQGGEEADREFVAAQSAGHIPVSQHGA